MTTAIAAHMQRTSAVVTASAVPAVAASKVVVRVGTADVIHHFTHGYGRGNSDAERELERIRDGSPGGEQDGQVMGGCADL